MNRDDITRMAREAGMPMAWISVSGVLNWSDLERFAALVAAAEREACAKLAEAFHQHGYDFTGDLELHDAIRARGQA